MKSTRITEGANLRHMAEARMTKKSVNSTSPLTAEEMRRLLHELQVHQVELEIQNEELNEARSDLESAIIRYSELYDFAPVGYFTLDRNSTIVRANLTGARLLGIERVLAKGAHFGAFVSKTSLPAYNTFIHNIFAFHSNEQCEVEIDQRDRDSLIVQLRATLSADGKSCNTVVIDVTERRRSERMLEQTEMRFQKLFQNLPSIAVRGYAPDGTILYWNHAAERFYGYPHEEALGRNVLDLVIPPEIRASTEHAFREMASTGRPIPASHMLVLKRDGTRANVFSSYAVVQSHAQSCEIFSMDVDLTDRIKMEHEVARLYAQAQELVIEKNALLNEVNHRVKNNLISILGLILAERRQTPGERRDIVYPVLEDFELRIASMLTVHQMLSESAWEPLNLSRMAEKVCSSVISTMKPDLGVALLIDPSDIVMSPRQANALALIFNELTTNSMKHAFHSCSDPTIYVNARMDEDAVCIEFRDNGSGYPETVLDGQQQHVGLRLVRQLTEETLGGTLILTTRGGAVSSLRIAWEEKGRT